MPEDFRVEDFIAGVKHQTPRRGVSTAVGLIKKEKDRRSVLVAVNLIRFIKPSS
jgi:hypothetical protein